MTIDAVVEPDTGPGARPRRWFLGRRAVRRMGWRHTDALVRAVGCGFALVTAGVVLHRLELLLIGAPLLVSAMVTTRPSGSPTVTASRPATTVESGRTSTVTVTVEPGEGAVFTALRMPVSGRSGIGPVHLLPAVAGDVKAEIRWGRWGRSDYLRPDHLLASHDGLYVLGPVVGRTVSHVVLPPVDPLPAATLPPRAAGLVGAHRSARAGDGMELRDIRPFQHGDRLRRIDWRVSLRAAAAGGGTLVPSTLHVRERHAEADADLLLALDTTIDVSADLQSWSDPTPARVPGSFRRGRSRGLADVRGSIDQGVRAATSLAAAFLRQGDRVGFVDLGQPRGGVPVGSGRRQLQLIRHALVRAAGRVTGGAEPVLRAAQVPLGATVVVLSPFLEDRLVDLTVRAVRRGNLVLAVDLLPRELIPDEETPWGEAVRSLLVAEHRLRLTTLAEQGVLVARWDDAGTIGPLLRAARRRPGVRR